MILVPPSLPNLGLLRDNLNGQMVSGKPKAIPPFQRQDQPESQFANTL
jgi:hypothetical protein